MQSANSLEKTWGWERLRVGGEGGDKEWDGNTHSVDMSLSKLREIVKDREAWSAGVQGVTKSQTQLSDWRTTPRLNENHSALLRKGYEDQMIYSKWR